MRVHPERAVWNAYRKNADSRDVTIFLLRQHRARKGTVTGITALAAETIIVQTLNMSSSSQLQMSQRHLREDSQEPLYGVAELWVPSISHDKSRKSGTS